MLGLTLTLVAPGCATVPAAIEPPYLIAARYDVEPGLVGVEEHSAEALIRRDFQTIADLGFNAVVLRHVQDRDRPGLMDLAEGADLKVVVSDRRWRRFVLTGVLPEDCRGASQIADNLPRRLMNHPALAALLVDPGRTRHATERATEIASSLRNRGATCVLRDSPWLRQESQVLATIDTGDAGDSSQEAPPLELWLAQFHDGLSRGRTAGLVVDRFRPVPGDPAAPVSFDRVLSPADATAIEALLTRARNWGPRLRGFRAQPIAAAITGGLDVRVTALIRARRRYVLVSNPTEDRYARGELTFPDSIGGAAVSRLVEVSSATDRGPGRVVNAARGHVTFSVELRPGDAILFEIF